MVDYLELLLDYPTLFFRYYYHIIIIGVICIIFIVSFAYRRRKNKQLITVLENIALRRNGFVQTRLFGYPVLTFSFHDNTIRIYATPGSRYQLPYTHCVADLTQTYEHSLTVYNETMASRIGKTLGMKDIQIGFHSFDDAFMIKGSDEYMTTRLLPIEVQNKLLELRSFRPLLSLAGHKFSIRIPKILSIEDDYERLIETALVFLENLRHQNIL